jgi:hypothetical protein
MRIDIERVKRALEGARLTIGAYFGGATHFEDTPGEDAPSCPFTALLLGAGCSRTLAWELVKRETSLMAGSAVIECVYGIPQRVARCIPAVADRPWVDLRKLGSDPAYAGDARDALLTAFAVPPREIEREIAPEAVKNVFAGLPNPDAVRIAVRGLLLRLEAVDRVLERAEAEAREAQLRGVLPGPAMKATSDGHVIVFDDIPKPEEGVKIGVLQATAGGKLIPLGFLKKSKLLVPSSLIHEAAKKAYLANGYGQAKPKKTGMSEGEIAAHELLLGVDLGKPDVEVAIAYTATQAIAAAAAAAEQKFWKQKVDEILDEVVAKQLGDANAEYWFSDGWLDDKELKPDTLLALAGAVADG